MMAVGIKMVTFLYARLNTNLLMNLVVLTTIMPNCGLLHVGKQTGEVQWPAGDLTTAKQ